MTYFDFFSFKCTRKVISMVKGLQANGFIRELHGLSLVRGVSGR